MLYEFVQIHRDEIIRRCKAKVALRSVPPASAEEHDHGVPLFLDQLQAALFTGGPKLSAEISRSAALHGQELLRQGFTVSQVVHDYGDVCQSITDLAVETNAPVSTSDFRILNRCLDDAIAGAVTEFGQGRNQSTLDGAAARGNERLGFMAHELRNLVNMAIVAFEVLKTGNVGVGGSTGKVLHRSILGARDLIGRSLAEVRLTHGIEHMERLLVSRFIDELAPGALMEAEARGVTLAIMPVEAGVAVEADRQVLGAVVRNLLQNALKFTRPQTTVTLRVGASDERVLIEVEDACGGLAVARPVDPSRPFERRNADRSGKELGLAFSRWGAQANNGRLSTRNVPEHGCVFIVDLPRVTAPVAATA